MLLNSLLKLYKTIVLILEDKDKLIMDIVISKILNEYRKKLGDEDDS